LGKTPKAALIPSEIGIGTGTETPQALAGLKKTASVRAPAKFHVAGAEVK